MSRSDELENVVCTGYGPSHDDLILSRMGPPDVFRCYRVFEPIDGGTDLQDMQCVRSKMVGRTGRLDFVSELHLFTLGQESELVRYLSWVHATVFDGYQRTDLVVGLQSTGSALVSCEYLNPGLSVVVHTTPNQRMGLDMWVRGPTNPLSKRTMLSIF